METVSIACPLLNTYSALFDVRSLDPSRILLKLSKGLSPRDTVTFYGTLDSTATDASANLTLLGSLPGNNGDPSSALSVSGWPFLFAFRSAGTSPGGSIIASGNENGAGGSLAPPSVALPALNAYSTVIDLSPLAGNEFLIGLDANQTSRDTFNIYGTNDATAGGGSGAAGGQILGTLHGGDGASGTALITNGFRYVFFQRTGGSTAGSAFAWGTSVSAGGGSPNFLQAANDGMDGRPGVLNGGAVSFGGSYTSIMRRASGNMFVSGEISGTQTAQEPVLVDMYRDFGTPGQVLLGEWSTLDGSIGGVNYFALSVTSIDTLPDDLSHFYTITATSSGGSALTVPASVAGSGPANFQIFELGPPG